jgi:hypothetical protein
MQTLHYCEDCKRWFDSPSICMQTGKETTPHTFGGPIQLCGTMLECGDDGMPCEHCGVIREIPTT